jgi:hypothetical protein
MERLLGKVKAAAEEQKQLALRPPHLYLPGLSDTDSV